MNILLAQIVLNILFIIQIVIAFHIINKLRKMLAAQNEHLESLAKIVRRQDELLDGVAIVLQKHEDNFITVAENLKAINTAIHEKGFIFRG